MNSRPRVAFLPDTFHELNGVAQTSRQLEVFAKRENIPFLSIHCGPVSQSVVDGSVTRLELKRGFTAFALDSNLRCDPCLFRYRQTVLDRVSAFGAQIIHVTGPGDMGNTLHPS